MAAATNATTISSIEPHLGRPELMPIQYYFEIEPFERMTAARIASVAPQSSQNFSSSCMIRAKHQTGVPKVRSHGEEDH
jgi:hypothetical protein